MQCVCRLRTEIVFHDSIAVANITYILRLAQSVAALRFWFSVVLWDLNRNIFWIYDMCMILNLWYFWASNMDFWVNFPLFLPCFVAIVPLATYNGLRPSKCPCNVILVVVQPFGCMLVCTNTLLSLIICDPFISKLLLDTERVIGSRAALVNLLRWIGFCK